jgi:hypothetical protein
MTLKTLAFAGLAAAGLALGAGAADAKTRVHIGIGIGTGCVYPYDNCYGGYGGGGYDAGYGYYGGYPQEDYVYRPRHHHYGYDYSSDGDYGGLSCGEARRIVRDQGFRHVEARDCSGLRYRFTGWRDGDPYLIKLSSQSGQIISVRPLY